jgi:para-nitrobenzyl esterase
MCGMESGLAGGVKKTKENNASKIPELKGAVHSADIEYAMGTLPTNRVYDWKLDDYVVSDIFKSFYVNFIKNGDPNSIGLPEWPNTNNKEIPPVMNIDYKTYLEEDADLESRYKFLDRILPIKNR